MRSGLLAGLATFAASASLHMYGILVAGATLGEAVLMACFFIVQMPVIDMERRVLGWLVRAGRPMAAAVCGRVILWLTILFVSPLFYEPVLRLAGL